VSGTWNAATISVSTTGLGPTRVNTSRMRTICGSANAVSLARATNRLSRDDE
jgi:hypothetical protein